MMTIPTPISTQAPRSTFVNVLAWIAIALTSLATLGGLLQLYFFGIMLSGEGSHSFLSAFSQSPKFPEGIQFFLDIFEYLSIAFFILCLFALSSAINLLRRQNWARIAFIAFLGLGIAWHLFYIVLSYTSYDSTFYKPPIDTEAMGIDIDTMMTAGLAFSAIVQLAFCALYVWIIRKLTTPAVLAEFET